MSGDRAPDLGDLARTWWEPLWPRSTRARVAGAVGLAVVLGAYVVLGVSLVASGGDLWRLVQPTATPVLLLLVLPRGTAVTPAGLARRRGVLRVRRAPWRDVVAVEPPGRWRDNGIARLADGRVLDLVAVPPDDVVRLAAALAQARAEPEGSRD